LLMLCKGSQQDQNCLLCTNLQDTVVLNGFEIMGVLRCCKHELDDIRWHTSIMFDTSMIRLTCTGFYGRSGIFTAGPTICSSTPIISGPQSGVKWLIQGDFDNSSVIVLYDLYVIIVVRCHTCWIRRGLKRAEVKAWQPSCDQRTPWKRRVAPANGSWITELFTSSRHI
jgi:hypothetical protein